MRKDSLVHKQAKALLRAGRARARNRGTAEQPRLSVHISNQHISAQIIDDEAGKTLVYVTTVGAKTAGTMTEKAAWVGGEIAKRAQKSKVKRVFFDKGARRYHGQVKNLAEAARAGGLEF